MKIDVFNDDGYIDYPGTIFSYMPTVDSFFIVSERDVGKTYGLRKSFVEDWLKRKERFTEICRFSSELPEFTDGYFNKLEEENEFPNHMFKTEANKAYIAKVCNEDETPQWEMFGYFVALTAYQRLKKKTFSRVRKIVLDEAVIDKDDKFHTYLPNEYKILMNMVSTILREKAGIKTRGKLFLIGNACDFTCPYLKEFGIEKPVEFGAYYHKNKTMMFIYVEPIDPEKKMQETLVGRMLEGNKEAEMVFENKFSNANTDYIADKSAQAKFSYGIKFKGLTFGVWLDYYDGIFYISKKIPNNHEHLVYSLTTKDNKIDNRIARKTENDLQTLINLYYRNGLRYETIGLRECFMQVLAYFGIH